MGCCDELLVKEQITNINNHPPEVSGKGNQDQNDADDNTENNKLIINKKPLSRSRTNAKDFDLDTYIKLILKMHNDLREKHNSPPLLNNEELNTIASEYAESLVNNNGKYIYSPKIYKGQLVGENIVISESKRPEEIFNSLIKGQKIYDYDENKFSKITGNFSQIIWKETTDIGIGFWHDKNNKKYYSVILYYPIGNCLGEFKENVIKEKD